MSTNNRRRQQRQREAKIRLIILLAVTVVVTAVITSIIWAVATGKKKTEENKEDQKVEQQTPEQNAAEPKDAKTEDGTKTADPDAAKTDDTGDYKTDKKAGTFPETYGWFLPFAGKRDDGYILGIDKIDEGNIEFTIFVGNTGENFDTSNQVLVEKHTAHVEADDGDTFVYKGDSYTISIQADSGQNKVTVTGLDDLISSDKVDNPGSGSDYVFVRATE